MIRNLMSKHIRIFSVFLLRAEIIALIALNVI